MANSVNCLGQRIETKYLKGQTLAEVDKDRRKNGLIDPNDKKKTRYYGLTDVTIEVKPEWVAPVGDPEVVGGGFKASVKCTKCSVDVSAVITYCQPKQLNKLSKEAKKEWKRFGRELEKHEGKHVDDGKKLAEKMRNEVLNLVATGIGASAEASHEAAKKALEDLLRQNYNPAEIEKRVNEAMKSRDSIDGHGSGSGATLRTSIA